MEKPPRPASLCRQPGGLPFDAVEVERVFLKPNRALKRLGFLLAGDGLHSRTLDRRSSASRSHVARANIRF